MVADPASVDHFADRGWNDGVHELIDEARRSTQDPGKPPVTEDWPEVVTWWIERMASPDSGLLERLTWFWHGLLTTGAPKVGSAVLVGRQLAMLRSHATGTYRDLLHAYVTDGALLEYLDGSYSMAANPNENLGRELMELFTIGAGTYTEDDVRAAARALAGWVVKDDSVEWRRDHAFVAPLMFRGVQDRWDTTLIVDHLCDQPETAVNVGSRMWQTLLGTRLTPEGAAELGAWWQSTDLDVLALVEKILTDPSAEESRLNKTRTGVEWFLAFGAAIGDVNVDPWALERLDQMPYYPPNVGGWPEGEHWVSPGSLLGRLSMIANLDGESVAGAGRAEVLDRCGLFELLPTTAAALEDLQRDLAQPSPETIGNLTWRLALSSPEFNLS